MPEVTVVLTIEDYVKAKPKPEYKKMAGYYDLEAACDACYKALPSEVVFGVPVLSNGLEWFGSDKNYTASGAKFQYSRRSVPWLFDNWEKFKRSDTVCACSNACAQTVVAEFVKDQQEKAKLQPQAPVDLVDKMCNHCGAAGADKRCSQCKEQYYCSRECQRDAWKAHCKVCTKGATPAPKPAAAKPQAQSNAAPSPEKTLKCAGCQSQRPASVYSSAQMKKKGKRKCSSCVSA